MDKISLEVTKTPRILVLTTGNNNMETARTAEAGETLEPLILDPKILYGKRP
jgi:hypothetical protein